MKLTIIRLSEPHTQDKIDLGKIWPENTAALLEISENTHLYAARFNERLLGAVRVTLSDTQGTLTALNIREITRRRGVGQYLVEEVLRDNPEIRHWKISASGVDDLDIMHAFAVALGFHQQGQDWEKSC